MSVTLLPTLAEHFLICSNFSDTGHVAVCTVASLVHCWTWSTLSITKPSLKANMVRNCYLQSSLDLNIIKWRDYQLVYSIFHTSVHFLLTIKASMNNLTVVKRPSTDFIISPWLNLSFLLM